MVVASDLAVYAKGSARPTGGAGSIAILIGPNAALVFENIRSTFMDNVYDFYKPVPNSEYPTVDGHLSINVYLNAFDQCYNSLKMKYRQKHDWEPMFTHFDYFCFHTPFSKMVQKSFMNLIYHDVKRYEQKH